jgi:heme/copper-type cytochrome/quinol oxidase subunit 3
MSTVTAELIRTLGPDERRGELGMLLFILSEVILFISLFFSYFLLARTNRAGQPTNRRRCCSHSSCW